ncbi:MAG: hypothetical protein APF84_19385 [Gracilibacter sp. BRH_c7a]|nr:MAG: hypothetical protein APF84_19385 [Gracilibacter sp. BRH_c7a]
MNINSRIDLLSISSDAFFMKKALYFRDGIESSNLKEHLDNTVIDFPKGTDKRFSEMRAKTLVGEVIPAFRIAQWKADKYPTIIYHHGALEEAYDHSFQRIFPTQMIKIPVNFIVVRSPFYANPRDFKSGIRSLDNFTALLATSTKLIEHLVLMAREIGSEFVTVAGLDMGGFISNIHHTYFNSADYYKPCLAGTSIDETFLNTVYSKLMSPLALNNKDMIRKALNLEKDFSQVDNSKVHPLLAKYDRVVELNRQKKYYRDENITIIDKGHITGTMSLRSLRQHILKFVYDYGKE